MLQMNENKITSQWTPEVFSWLKKTKISVLSSPPSERSHYLVLVEKSSKGLRLDADLLSSECQKDLLLQIKERELETLKEPLILTYKKNLYCLIEKSPLKTSSSQKGRELGALAAKKLSSYPIKNIILSSGQDISSLSLFLGYASGLYELKTFKEKKKQKEQGTKKFAENIFLLTKEN